MLTPAFHDNLCSAMLLLNLVYLAHSDVYSEILVCKCWLFPNPQLKNDEGFQEFLAVHKNRTQVPTWANDAVEAGAQEKSKKIEKQKEKKAVSDDYLNFDSDESVELSDDEDEKQGASEDENEQGVSLFLSYIKDRVQIQLYNFVIKKKKRKGFFVFYHNIYCTVKHSLIIQCVTIRL